MIKPYVIGIDIGGTNTVLGLVDARGQILSQHTFLTGDYATVEDYITMLKPSLKKLIEAGGGKENIQGIGIGAPGANYYTGEIVNAANLRWAKNKRVPLADIIKEKTGIKCILNNDAKAAAIGEMTYGVAKGIKDFIMITLGTGVGSGIVIDGKVVYGHDGFAGELGHTVVCRPNGRPCSCGQKGCLEMYSAARGIVATVRELIETSGKNSILSSYDLETLSPKEIHNAALEGDSIAIQALCLTGKILGEAFANFIVFSNPRAIVLFGGITKLGDFLINPIKESMENNLLDFYKEKTDILISELPESDAAVLGASALGWETKE